MASGLPMANICGNQLTSLTKLEIEGIDGLEYLPDWLFRNNQNISKLLIRKFPNLRELPDGLQNLHSLQELTIDRCPILKSIPYDSSSSSGLTSLQSLFIADCGRLADLPREMLESCVASLQYVRLENLSSVMNMPTIMECLHRMPRLTKVKILSVSKLISLLGFQDLILRPESDSWDCVSYAELVDGILVQTAASLRTLSLRGMEDWDSLPIALRHLAALSRLTLGDFGIEELPEWFVNLTSLQTLFVYSCKKLRRLRSMQRLTKLTELYVYDCPVLKERCISDDDGSEWLNICHIPNIGFDGLRGKPT